MIGILGGGQLGRMLALAGYPLGLEFCFLDPNPDAPVKGLGELIVAPYDDEVGLMRIAECAEVVTYEFENVPAAAIDMLGANVATAPPRDALRIAQDRLDEKRLFEEVGLQVPRYIPVGSPEDLHAALKSFAAPVVVKTRREGYDGKGQVVVRAPEDTARAEELVRERPCIVEELVEFRRELSVIAVRARGGEVRCYPLVENHHRGGILRLSLAPAPDLDPELQRRAEEHALALLERLAYVGVLTVELFERDGHLLGNEMAPRVHNSGHWTIEGSTTSQFENHLRAVLGLPLGRADALGDWVMVNLIGEVREPQRLLALPGIHMHLYGKEARPGRKLGHLTLPRADLSALAAVPGLELPLT